MRYADCQREDGNCELCSLSSYGKDCQGAPANRVAYLRKLAGITQTELASRTGFTKQWLSRLETGALSAANITLGKAVILARELGVEPQDLI